MPNKNKSKCYVTHKLVLSPAFKLRKKQTLILVKKYNK